MKAISVFAIAFSAFVLVGCWFSDKQTASDENAQTPPLASEPSTPDSVGKEKKDSNVAKFEGAAKTEMERVLVTAFDQCESQEFLSVSSSATEKAFPSDVAKKIKPADRTARCKVRAIVRENRSCDLADKNLRDDCEKLKLSIKTLSSDSSNEDQKKNAKIMYSTYFFDTEVFPVGKFGSTK